MGVGVACSPQGGVEPLIYRVYASTRQPVPQLIISPVSDNNYFAKKLIRNCLVSFDWLSKELSFKLMIYL